MAVVDRDGVMVHVNDAFTRRFAWSPGELRGREMRDLVHPGDRAAATAMFARLLSGEDAGPGDIAVRLTHRDGEWSWAAASGARAPDGSLVYAVLRPLSPTGQELPADGLLRAVAGEAPVAVYVKDRSYRYLYANDLVEAAYGVGPGGMIGQTDEDFLEPELHVMLRERDRRVVEQGEVVREQEVIGRAGGEAKFLSVKFPLRDAHGSVYAIAGVSTPVD
jgi:PAS domain S-box-containing protein